MAGSQAPYIPHNPGDLITAEDWNDLQSKIHKDIADQIEKAIKSIAQVPKADDADKLAAKSLQQIERDILDQVKALVPTLEGYTMILKRLRFDKTKKEGEQVVVKHGLKSFPLVDLYILDWFPVVCSEDDDRYISLVNFFLYHDSEKRIRFSPKGGGTGSAPTVQIEDDPHAFRISFKEMLKRVGVDLPRYEDMTLSEIESAFWSALDQAPNDSFDDEQQCHSPWFDRCCGESRTKSAIGHDFDRLYFMMRPRRLANLEAPVPQPPTGFVRNPADPAPEVEIVHFDFDTLGLRLLEAPTYAPVTSSQIPNLAGPIAVPPPLDEEVTVMVLLKV